MSRLLLVDADWSSRRALTAALRYGRFDTESVSTVRDAGRRLRREPFAGVVVDVGEAGAVEALADLRVRSDAALIAVVPDEDRDLTIACLDAGADDVVGRTVDPEELLARLRAVLRRSEHGGDEAPIVTPDFVIDLADRRATLRDGTEVQLSPIEWKLVEVLVHRAGHLVTREALLTTTWGPEAVDKAQYLRVYMASIRRKLEPDRANPRYFVTAPGLGLKFDPAPYATVERS